MKVSVEKRFGLKRKNAREMFNFKASLWSGEGSEHKGYIGEFEHSPFEAFFAEIREENLVDWARGEGHGTVRECLRKEKKCSPWVFKAHERALAPKRMVHNTSCDLMGALSAGYHHHGFGGNGRTEPRLSRADERKFDKMLDALSAWWLAHVRMGAPYYHTVKRFKIYRLDALEILEKFKPEWLDAPVIEEHTS